MKIFLVGLNCPGALEISYLNAFKKLQCNVKYFNLEAESENISWLNGNRTWSRISRKILRSYLARLMNERLLKMAAVFQPDLILVFKGIFIFPQTLKKLKENTNSVLFNFNPDNPFNQVNSSQYLLDSLTIYDCLFIWGKFLIPDLLQKGAQRVEYLPFAHDPELHHPVSVTDEERERYGSDIVFIGTWEKQREKWLENLVDYDLKIWGNLWEEIKWFSPLKQKWMKKPVIGNEFAKVCCSSRIMINFIRAQNGKAHNMRTFEVPACQGFLLTEYTEEQSEFFEDGKHIAFFKDVAELRDQVEKYLNNEESRQRLARAASINVLQHTYEMRVKKILDIFKEMHITR